VRVVFDTSSLVGAALQVGSLPHRALGVALAAGQLCASAQTLTELQQVLRRPKFDRYQPLGLRREFFDIVAAAAVIHEVSAADEAAVQPRCRDPKDDMFLALAQVCQGDVIVSSDADLIALDPWHEVRILRPAAFLEQYG
jgi:uncharacterized protein